MHLIALALALALSSLLASHSPLALQCQIYSLRKTLPVTGSIDTANYIIVHKFQDRYAEGRFLPPIDESQDWFLTNSEEENGYTVLEFFRNLTSCDPQDLDITVGKGNVWLTLLNSAVYAYSLQQLVLCGVSVWTTLLTLLDLMPGDIITKAQQASTFSGEYQEAQFLQQVGQP